MAPRGTEKAIATTLMIQKIPLESNSEQLNAELVSLFGIGDAYSQERYYGCAFFNLTHADIVPACVALLMNHRFGGGAARCSAGRAAVRGAISNLLSLLRRSASGAWKREPIFMWNGQAASLASPASRGLARHLRPASERRPRHQFPASLRRMGRDAAAVSRRPGAARSPARLLKRVSFCCKIMWQPTCEPVPTRLDVPPLAGAVPSDLIAAFRRNGRCACCGDRGGPRRSEGPDSSLVPAAPFTDALLHFGTAADAVPRPLVAGNGLSVGSGAALARDATARLLSRMRRALDVSRSGVGAQCNSSTMEGLRKTFLFCAQDPRAR
mmetsp:Transcript_42330/g.122898  ORF Transcript_42330/g.122898 Transcript_42330/m.122898 type:complete len:325 (-) Transcript_42330:64-1038(-)